MNSLILIYIVILIFGVLIFLFDLNKLKSKKKLIGTIYCKWSSRLIFSSPLNWIFWSIVLAYLCWSLYLITTEPHRDIDYTPLVIFFFSLSFFGRWNVLVGSKGIISRMKVIDWERVIEREIVERGKVKYLKLKLAPGLIPSTKRIPIPPKYLNNLNQILNKISQ